MAFAKKESKTESKKEKAALDKMSIEEMEAAVNKKFGAGTLARASVSRGLSIPRIEIGIFAMDHATGGGIPVGRISGIYGKKSSCKSATALKIVASAQGYCRKHLVKMVPIVDRFYVCDVCGARSPKKGACKDCKDKGTVDKDGKVKEGKFETPVDVFRKAYRCDECGFRGEKEGEPCPDCKEAGFESYLVDRGDFQVHCPVCKEHSPMITVWMDAEGCWENRWSASMGINCHYVYTIRTEYAEQAMDVSDRLIRYQKCDLLVIDTIAHLVPKAEVDESAENWQMGLQARLVNKLLRKLVSAQNRQNLNSETRPTILVLNQVRMKVGFFLGDPETKPGGMGQEFATSLDIKMWAGKYEKDDDGNTLSLVSNFRCVKNKVGVPMQEGNFRFWLRPVNGHSVGDTEEIGVVLGIALKHNLLGDSKNGWCFGDRQFKTKDEVISYVKNDPLAFETVRSVLRGKMLGKIVSDADALDIDDEDDGDAE